MSKLVLHPMPGEGFTIGHAVDVVVTASRDTDATLQLTIKLRPGQTLSLGEERYIGLMDARSGGARVLITAPRELRIIRKERPADWCRKEAACP